jgi:hypothetical protein
VCARQAFEEIGLALPLDAFELVASGLERTVTNGGAFVNNGAVWGGARTEPRVVDCCCAAAAAAAAAAARAATLPLPLPPPRRS